MSFVCLISYFVCAARVAVITSSKNDAFGEERTGMCDCFSVLFYIELLLYMWIGELVLYHNLGIA